MSKSKSTKWVQQTPDAHRRVIRGKAELLVLQIGDEFLVTLTDEVEQEIWSGVYPSRVGAQVAGTAAAKRLLSADDTIVVATGEPEATPADALSAKKDGPQSIWKATTLLTLVEGKGVVIPCVINVFDDCIEGIVKLGDYVFQQEYETEWSAKHDVVRWANLLIERHA